MARPTMADVAARAGVTVATVSRALSDRTSAALRAETVAHVRAVAEELGYRPNALARGLRTQRSLTLGMLAPDLTNPFMPPVVRAVEEALERAGYTLIVANTDNEPRREAQALQTFASHQVEGLVLATATLDDDWQVGGPAARLPVVLVNRRSRFPLPTVVPDDAHGVASAVGHLTDLGHRRVAHIAGPLQISTGRARAEAFERAVARAGTDGPPPVEHTSRLTVDEGERACARLLDRRPDVTAIFAANDMLAIGCLRALRRNGVRVPEEVSLVGFNDMQFVDLLDPPLTTVRVPQAAMGQAAAALLLELVGGATPPPTPALVELPGSLIVRGSTAPPRP
jgi:LacI family transcriptional regulator